MIADDRVALVRHKSDRAKKHITELQIELSKFLDSKPYVVATKRNPQTRQLIYYILSVRETPPIISIILGDILQCFRSTLDHLVYQLLLVNGIPEADTYGFDFPIGRDLGSYRSQAGKLGKGYTTKQGRVIKGIRQDAMNAIDAIEPYPTGKGALLWTLHYLNNIDKHRTILTAGAQFASVDIGRFIVNSMRRTQEAAGMPPDDWDLPLYIRPADKLFPLKAGDELLILGPDDEPDEKQQFHFEVAFAESKVVEGKPIGETVDELTNLVNGIVTTFHAAGLLAP